MKVLVKGPWEAVNQFGTRRKRSLTYRARFFDNGKYVEQDCADILYQKTNSSFQLLNTSSNVSYYGALLKDAAR